MFSDRERLVDMSSVPEFKLILVGDGGVGREEYLQYMFQELGGHPWEKKYVASLGIHIVSLRFYTNRGPIQFNVWDIAGLSVRIPFVCIVCTCNFVGFILT